MNWKQKWIQRYGEDEYSCECNPHDNAPVHRRELFFKFFTFYHHAAWKIGFDVWHFHFSKTPSEEKDSEKGNKLNKEKTGLQNVLLVSRNPE